jgi:uncharacterized protein (DUF2336 family)
MSGLLSRLTGWRKKVEPLDYEEAKRLALDESPQSRRALATREDARPEILYFLAKDPGVDVRRAVARNEATPVQAGLILADDSDTDVRCDLAQRIGRLAPQLDESSRERIGTVVDAVLAKLASDQVPRVRQLLAEELKHAVGVSSAVIEKLARDDDPSVAAPVLEYSPLLNDELLLDIIAGTPEGAALLAISRRAGLTEPVADAVVATDDDDAICSLLSNRSAQIREETLDTLVEQSASVPTWHAPLVLRPALSGCAVRRLAEFVADALVRDLERRSYIDAKTAAALSRTMRDRLGEEEELATEDAARETADERALKLFKQGKLTEKLIATSLDRGDRSFVIEALALMAELPSKVVAKSVSMASAKGMVAVAWKASLSMKTAALLQIRLARIPPGNVLQARSGGEFPLTEDEMLWQLDFLAG